MTENQLMGIKPKGSSSRMSRTSSSSGPDSNKVPSEDTAAATVANASDPLVTVQSPDATVGTVTDSYPTGELELRD